MSLQSKYRLERDKIMTYENESFYIAYRIVNYEFHILEMYVPEEKRGFLNLFFNEIYKFVKENHPNMLFMVATVIAGEENSEKMLMGLLKYNFKMIKAENNVITVLWSII